ncbi:MAG: DNA repair protein RecN [Chloroflexi bacterium]|nr:DNA repair protein RecN [Chloroflexota bacterium]
MKLSNYQTMQLGERMLAEIDITNFAIIEHLHLQFHRGFNVMTGETGAGKSIIIDAVGMLLGGRAQAEFVRADTAKARVEGTFALSNSARETIVPILDEIGIEHEDEALIITREIHREGRNTCRVNGRTVTMHTLQRIGEFLIDIHGQSEHLSLLRVREHVDFLDRYGNLWEQRARVAEQVKRLRAVRNEIKTLMVDAREAARRVDRLTYVVEEISDANLRIGEEEALKQERELLGNAELRANLADHAYRSLYGAGEDDKGAIDLLNEALQAVTGLEKYDAAVKSAREEAESAAAQADDLARSLRAYRDGVEHNPKRLAQIDERVDLIFRLKRKYGDTIEEIIKYGENAAAELATISHSEERTKELQQQETQLLKEIAARAGDLSRARREAGERLSREIEAQLQDLGMAKAKFGVALERADDANGPEVEGRRVAVDTTGIDRAEFLVSPNPGEPLKPLAKIASGGETSRLMLAMKSVLAVADNTPTLIFDEIDQGIGGRTGGIVGNKLWALTPTAQKISTAPRHQVICITHLPQIAAFGDAHFKIHKEIVGERTITKIDSLDNAARVEELAQMLGTATATTRQNAEELLAEVKSQKEKGKSKK